MQDIFDNSLLRAGADDKVLSSAQPLDNIGKSLRSLAVLFHSTEEGSGRRTPVTNSDALSEEALLRQVKSFKTLTKEDFSIRLLKQEGVCEILGDKEFWARIAGDNKETSTRKEDRVLNKARRILDLFDETLLSALTEHSRVTFGRFGTFIRSRIKARDYVIPGSTERALSHKKYRIKFSPSKELVALLYSDEVRARAEGKGMINHGATKTGLKEEGGENKSSFVKRFGVLAGGLPRRESLKLIDAYFATVRECLSSGYSCGYRGSLGSFQPKVVKSRAYVHPVTKDKILKPSRLSVTYRVSELALAELERRLEDRST